MTFHMNQSSKLNLYQKLIYDHFNPIYGRWDGMGQNTIYQLAMGDRG